MYVVRVVVVILFCCSESESEVAQSTLCDPMDCSLPGSSVHGIFQARVLEWVAVSFLRGSSQHRDRTRVSSIVSRRFYPLSHQGSPDMHGAWTIEHILRANSQVSLYPLVLKRTQWSWQYQPHFIEEKVGAVKVLVDQWYQLFVRSHRL